MIASVQITKNKQSSSQLWLPIRSIVQNSQGGFALFRLASVKGHAVAQLSNITIGKIRDNKVALLAGAKEGDIIIVGGITRLYHGAAVFQLQTKP